MRYAFKTTGTLSHLLLMGAGYYMAVYISYLAPARLFFPFELHWMEGGSAAHVMQILRGKMLYSEPSLDFIPYTYTPFYFYLAAWLTPEAESALFTLRLISFASFLGTLVLIYLLIKKALPGFGWIIPLFRVSGKGSNRRSEKV
jgi:hypothetical protein